MDMGRPIVTNEEFVALVCKSMGSNRAAVWGGELG